MTAYSGMMHDPAKVPTCSKPKTESCDTMLCSWKNEWDTPVWHTYQFLRCAKPQAFRLILEEGLHVLNGTYDTSGVIVVNATMSLNITVKHPSDQVLGFKVCLQFSQLVIVLDIIMRIIIGNENYEQLHALLF